MQNTLPLPCYFLETALTRAYTALFYRRAVFCEERALASACVAPFHCRAVFREGVDCTEPCHCRGVFEKVRWQAHARRHTATVLFLDRTLASAWVTRTFFIFFFLD
jgi:hypothetical protein